MTFLDLFKNEDWWDRYRSGACAILVGDDVLVTQKLDPAVAAEGARRARAHDRRLGAGARFARADPPGRDRQPTGCRAIGITFTLLLGRPLQIERCWTSCGPRPAGALALSDGRRIRTSTGDDELGALASTLVGREADGSFAADDADWTAAAVPVADKLWVVGLAHRSGRSQPMAVALGLRCVRRDAAPAGRGPARAPAGRRRTVRWTPARSIAPSAASAAAERRRRRSRARLAPAAGGGAAG